MVDLVIFFLHTILRLLLVLCPMDYSVSSLDVLDFISILLLQLPHWTLLLQFGDDLFYLLASGFQRCLLSSTLVSAGWCVVLPCMSISLLIRVSFEYFGLLVYCSAGSVKAQWESSLQGTLRNMALIPPAQHC